MKRFLTTLGLSLLAAFAVIAQTSTAGTLAAGLNAVVTGAYNLDQITLLDTSGTNQLVILYDTTGSTTTNRVYGAYTNRVQYPTTIVTSFTDQAGVATLQTNAIYAYTNVTVAAATNEARRVFQGYVPANGTLVINPPGPVGFNYGLQIKTVGTALYNLTYKQLP